MTLTAELDRVVGKKQGPIATVCIVAYPAGQIGTMGDIPSLLPRLGTARIMTGETDFYLFSQQHGVAGAGMRIVASCAP